MEYRRVWVLRGPNVWSLSPAIEVEVDLTGFPVPSADLADRLTAWLPPTGRRWAAFCRCLRERVHPVHLLQHVTLELQARVGFPLDFGLAQETFRDSLSRFVVGYEEEAVCRACLDAALELSTAAARGLPYATAATVERLHELANDVRLGPSTAAIVRAALARGIPFRRLNTGSLVQLGQGIHQRRILAAETDATSAVAEAVAKDKELTRTLLRAVGVPVPDGRPVADAEGARAAAEELGGPVVVKPQDGNHGRGVTTNLTTAEQVGRAYAAARAESEHVLVETFVPGEDHRLLVIGNRLVAAALREPAHVVGDGRSTVAQLIDEVNRDPRRSDGHSTVLSKIQLDAVGLSVLAEQGFTPESVPPADAKVLIRRNGNLSTGGTATDVTDRVHPDVAERAVEAARVVGLDVAGVDVVATDVSRPLEEQGGAVVEVNAGPGLRMHLEPSAGTPRPVGEAIVDLLFPPGQTGRIPVVAVTGINGKTTTTRLIAHLLAATGRKVGMTCTDGTYVGGRRTEARDSSGPQSARAVLAHPRVEAAVLETARGGILREGLGFDRCDVAVVTNVGSGDHLGLRGIDNLDGLARVKQVVVAAVAPAGAAVLNAADPLVTAMAPHCPGAVVFFARDPGNPLLNTHRAAGGRAVFARDGVIYLAEGAHKEGLLPLGRVPLTQPAGIPFQVENVLAATAAAWSLGLPLDVIRTALETFFPSPDLVPGRFNVLPVGEAVVIVDYAHNPSAVAALVAALDYFPHRRRTLVFTGCNRRDADVIEMGALAGDAFDRIILYRDVGHSDRADGELNGLLRRGLASGRRASEVSEAGGEREALAAALQSLQPRELAVLGVESVEESLAFIREQLSALFPMP
jgi:cyanophycin synthetase